MTTLGEQLNLADSLGMTVPRVNALLRLETLLLSLLGWRQIDIDVGRNVQVRTTEIVV